MNSNILVNWLLIKVTCAVVAGVDAEGEVHVAIRDLHGKAEVACRKAGLIFFCKPPPNTKCLIAVYLQINLQWWLYATSTWSWRDQQIWLPSFMREENVSLRSSWPQPRGTFSGKTNCATSQPDASLLLFGIRRPVSRGNIWVSLFLVPS